MLNAAWLIVHLMGSAAPMLAGTAAKPAGVSCTYQACMAKCGRLNGAICNTYCDAKIPQRVAVGVCPSRGPYGG
ncbi:MAG: hypothetical protein J0G36_03685 [Afipia sp.]|jgi:hypothetical protein|nr:hypothetical protein [Afipia sp.]